MSRNDNLPNDACPNNPQNPDYSVRFYCVRHGESEANLKGFIAGQSDVPLTERGIDEAKRLGSRSPWISGTPFLRVYSSDLSRARDTALIALREGKRQQDLVPLLVQDRRLRERSYGHRQGFPRSMGDEEILQIWKERNEQPPVYETDEDLWVRGKAWIVDVLTQIKNIHHLDHSEDVNNKEETRSEEKNTINGAESNPPKIYHVLVVAHAGMIRAMITNLIPTEILSEMGAKYDPKRNNRLIVPNTSVTILEFSHDGAGDDDGKNEHRAVDEDPYVAQTLSSVKVVELTNAKHLESINIYDD